MHVTVFDQRLSLRQHRPLRAPRGARGVEDRRKIAPLALRHLPLRGQPRRLRDERTLARGPEREEPPRPATSGATASCADGSQTTTFGSASLRKYASSAAV